MPYVGVGRRFLAFVIDALLSLVWNAPFWEIRRSPGHFTAHLGGGRTVAVVLIWFVYYVAMETAFGATIGKLAMGLRVARADGSKPDLADVVKRTLARAVDGLPYGPPYVVGAILVWTSPKRQRLGDRWAGTVVVPSGARLGPPAPPMPPPPPMPGAPGPTP